MTDRTDVAKHWEANAETWTKHARAGYDVYRDTLNAPAFLAMLPEVAGLTGLDVACGEGSSTRDIARAGAKMQGIDIAPSFIRIAKAGKRERVGAHQVEALGIVQLVPFDPVEAGEDAALEGGIGNRVGRLAMEAVA